LQHHFYFLFFSSTIATHKNMHHHLIQKANRFIQNN
jgi:hypothetical protein